VVRDLERLDLTTTDFRRLLLEVQRYVDSPSCPVCGTQHESRADLLSKITARLEGDPASQERGHLAALRQRRREAEDALAATAEAEKRANSAIDDRKRERLILNGTILDFVSATEAAGIVLTSPILSVEDDLSSRLARISDERRIVSDRRAQVGHDLETAQATATSLKASLALGTRELARLRKTIDRLGVDIAALDNDAAAQRVPLSTDAEALDARAAVCQKEMAGLDAERVKLEAARADSRIASAGAEKSLDSVTRDLRDCRTRLATLQTEQTQGDALAKAASVPEGATATLVGARVSAEIARRTELASAREATSALEIAIDSATTAASHDRLRRDIQVKEDELSFVISAREENRPWLLYFERAAQLVSAQQGRAIAAFTTEYGPRASTIQRRLRPVYGFDDVEVRSEDSSIVVRVHRGKDELHPTEYFSQSQVQTLLLSLFLTACVSQTWSSLSPIFLDDPVTHFDDLNTYAFLDLIVGLLDVEGHGRQFVLSTCDEKFLQLARQKFRHLGQAAKFYQFSAIGADGPDVAELV
jgi:exonuclease SbcC